MASINQAITRVSKAYSENTTFRGLVNLIPNVGGTLDIIFTERWNSLTQARIEDFMECVKDEFAAIEENSINKDFLESNDFTDLTVKCLASSAKSRHREKIKLFAKVLKNAVTLDKFNVDEFDEILPTFELVSMRELLVLNHLDTWEYNLANNYSKMLGYSEVRKSSEIGGFAGIPVYFGLWEAFKDTLIKISELNNDDIEYLLQTSSQKGLFSFGVYDTSVHTGKYKSTELQILAARDSFRHTMNGKLTPLFKRLKKYILDVDDKATDDKKKDVIE